MATLEEIFGSEMVENTIFEELSKKAPIVRTTKNKKAMVRLGKPYSSYHFQEVDMNDDNFMIMYKMLNEKDEDGNEAIEKISSFEVDPVLNENGKINVVRIRPQMKKTENGILYATDSFKDIMKAFYQSIKEEIYKKVCKEYGVKKDCQISNIKNEFDREVVKEIKKFMASFDAFEIRNPNLFYQANGGKEVSALDVVLYKVKDTKVKNTYFTREDYLKQLNAKVERNRKIVDGNSKKRKKRELVK